MDILFWHFRYILNITENAERDSGGFSSNYVLLLSIIVLQESGLNWINIEEVDRIR